MAPQLAPDHHRRKWTINFIAPGGHKWTPTELAVIDADREFVRAWRERHELAVLKGQGQPTWRRCSIQRRRSGLVYLSRCSKAESEALALRAAASGGPAKPLLPPGPIEVDWMASYEPVVGAPQAPAMQQPPAPITLEDWEDSVCEPEPLSPSPFARRRRKHT